MNNHELEERVKIELTPLTAIGVLTLLKMFSSKNKFTPFMEEMMAEYHHQININMSDAQCTDADMELEVKMMLSDTKKNTMNREQHLKWCKDRALEYVDAGDNPNAFASFQSDMTKHEETKGHKALQLGTMLLLGGHLETPKGMKEWIIGFN